MASKRSDRLFDFVDLFAGIGGIRLGLESAGGRCVFTSEWDKFAQVTYETNFGEKPLGDIRQIAAADIPDHDVLAAGFPCQPFSVAGVSKKNSLGRKHGFECEHQGNLFFEIARVLELKMPRAILLENVKNLRGHDRGRTWGVIARTLDDLGYEVFPDIIDAAGWVPQHRERIYIVGFRRDAYPNPSFVFPSPPKTRPTLASILEASPLPKYTLSDHLWQYLQDYAEKHRRAGNGFGYGLVDPAVDNTTRTLSARYHKDGSEILIRQTGSNPRRLTPRECARLQGFSDDFQIPVSDTQAYRQFGNSVAVPVVAAVAKSLAKVLENGPTD